LVAVVADDSFQVKDYRIIQNVKAELASAGIKTIRFTGTEKPEWQGTNSKAMIVITGHIDAQLANFVRELGDKGYFTNNFVVFNSCRAPLTRTLIDEINSKYGAAATFAYDKKIDILLSKIPWPPSQSD